VAALLRRGTVGPDDAEDEPGVVASLTKAAIDEERA
jgi:hypothetical protein